MPNSIILFSQSLASLQKMEAFFSDNSDFFSKEGQRFQAYALYENYELVILRVAQVHFAYAERKNVTHELLFRFVYLLQNSPVKDALDNAQKYGGHLFHYLLWLASSTANLDDTFRRSHFGNAAAFSTPASMVAQSTLTLHHEPSCASLRHTFLLALGRKQEQLPVRASLILESPTGTINREQLEYVLNMFAELIFHYFKLLCTDFTTSRHKENYIYYDISDNTTSFELLIQGVTEATPYNISLKDAVFDEFLFSRNIQHAMKFLEGGESLVLDQPLICLPKLVYSDSSSKQPGGGSQYRFIMPCQRINALSHRVMLRVVGNTYPEASLESSQQVVDAQIGKIKLAQHDTTAFIPAISMLFADIATKKNSILQDFYRHPTSLHTLTQSDLSRWILDAPVRELYVATLSLLSRVQDKEPFTLPASAEILHVIQYFMGYLIAIPRMDESYIARYVDLESLEVLRKARGILQRFGSSTTDDLDEKIESFREKVFALYRSAQDLSSVEELTFVRNLLLFHFGVKFPIQHNIAYPPYEVSCVITQSLQILTNLYAFVTGVFLIDGTSYDYGVSLICKGIMPLFMLQSEIDIPHLVKASCLPVGLVGVSFDMCNRHDGVIYSPARFWQHDYLFHMYFSNTIIDALWKLQQNSDRVCLMHNIWEVRFRLLSHHDTFVFVDETVNSSDLLGAFDLLLFLLMHENAEWISTQTRARISPISFSHVFLEKIRSYFELYALDAPDELRLMDKFSNFSDALKRLLPLKGNSSFPYFMAYILFDVILEQTRNAQPHVDVLSASYLLSMYCKALDTQQRLLYLYENNWEALVQNGILYPACSHIEHSRDRFRALALPHFQERLRLQVFDFPLKGV